MDNSAILEIILRARDEASATIGNLRNSLDKVKPGADIVTGAMIGMGVAVVGASAYSIKMASDFQSSMTLVQTQAGASSKEVETMSKAILNLAGETATAPKTLADGLFYIESAGYRGAKALDILKLAAEGAKVGHADLGQTANVLTTIMNSNIKGVNNATDAMGLLNATVGAGKMKMGDLVGAMSTGIIPTAQALGISMQGLGASIATMTNNGVPAEEAATRLKMAFAMMEDPTTKASKALEAIGISHRQLADDMRSSGGLSTALEDIKSHLNAVEPATTSFVKGTKMSADQVAAVTEKVKLAKEQIQILNDTHVKGALATEKHAHALEAAQATLSGYEAKLGKANSTMTAYAGGALDATQKTQLLLDAFGGGRQGSTMLTLIGHTDQFNDRLKQITKTGGDFQNAWKKTTDDANFAFEKLGTVIQTLAIKFGNELLPNVTRVANFLSNNLAPAVMNTVNWIEKNKTVLEIIAGIIATVVLPAFIAYELQAGIKNAVAVAKFIIEEWKAIAAIVMKAVQLGIATAAFILHTAAMAAGAIVTGVLTIATWALNAAIFLLTSPIGLVILAIIALIATGVFLITHWKQVQEVGKIVFDAVGKFFSDLGKTVHGVVDAIITDIKNMVNSIIDHINGLIHGINGVGSKIGLGSIKIPDIPKFDQGGYVPKTGIALLHEGEFVLSKSMLSGQSNVPSQIANQTTNNNNTPVTIYATINQDIDMNLLGQKIAFALRNSR